MSSKLKLPLSSKDSIISEYIPDHILSNVLVRLPIYSLFRFKCVSKSWHDLIDSSYFKEIHLRRSRSPKDLKIIVLFGSEAYTFDSVVRNIGEERYNANAKKLSNTPDMEYSRDLMLAESCNGIVFLSNYLTNYYVLWNPFTGSTLHSWQLTSPPYEFTSEYGEYIQTAFGYDHLNDDYKLVKWYSRGKGFDLYEVCVYSFKHKSWSTIRDAGKLDLDSICGYLPADCTFANGAMHWVMENNLILAFDLGTHKFKNIRLPVDHYVFKSLSSLNGCLCLAYNVSSGRIRSTAYIWVMKEYGVETSWNKIACIEQSWRMKVVAYSEKRRELMLQLDGIRSLVMYDLKTKSFSNVAVNGKVIPCCVCDCVGSFVSPLDLASI